MTYPTVSAVITTYNQAPYIQEAIKSAISQSYPPLEIIVVDDGSDDDTPERISPYRKYITYIRQENQGVAKSRNKGIEIAKGDYIAFLDGDDYWHPDKLSIQVSIAKIYNNSGLIAVNGIEFDGDNILRNSLFNGSYFDDIADDYICSKNLYFEFIKNNLICTTSQVMIPRIIFKDIGTSNWKYRIASDYDLYLRIAAKYNITIINKKLTYWRYLKTSASGPNDTRRYRYISEDISILKDQCQNNVGKNKNIIFCIIKEKIEEAARTYYNYGRNENKYDAIRMLRNLFAANILHPRIGIYLIALLCPPNIVSHLASVVRKIVKSRK